MMVNTVTLDCRICIWVPVEQVLRYGGWKTLCTDIWKWIISVQESRNSFVEGRSISVSLKWNLAVRTILSTCKGTFLYVSLDGETGPISLSLGPGSVLHVFSDSIHLLYFSFLPLFLYLISFCFSICQYFLFSLPPSFSFLSISLCQCRLRLD